MDTFGERLRAAMLAKGLRAPEDLARIAGISVGRAQRWLAMREARVLACRLAPVARKLRVRMLWLSTGETVPQVSGSLTPDDLAALDVAAMFEDSGKFRRWIARGKRISQDP